MSGHSFVFTSHPGSNQGGERGIEVEAVVPDNLLSDAACPPDYKSTGEPEGLGFETKEEYAFVNG